MVILSRSVWACATAAAALVALTVQAQPEDPPMLPLGTCGLAQPALCETFDAPSPLGAGTRSGDLDGVLWGVSHATSDDNPSQHREFTWQSSQLERCGQTVTVLPPRDVQICDGHLVESMADAGAVTVLAMYPRQPFDIAGRTGTVAFDVGNDTEGSHMAWPEFVWTDQPVPAPFEVSAGVANLARNSFGFQMAGDCRNGQLVENGQGDSWAVNELFTTSDYAFTTRSFAMKGCVKKGSPAAMNHVEVRFSQTHQEVWASEPGGAGLKLMASADIPLTLARGLVWIEDVHYNACKPPGTQCNHTFAWDNVGFDGPVLPRDLGFDIPDHFGDNLGWLVPAGGALDLKIVGVRDLDKADAAVLVLTEVIRDRSSLTYSLNGHPAHTAAYPFGAAPTYVSQTIALPVPLTELQAGTNALHLTSSATSLGGLSVANFDLILAGAGGSTGPPATATPTPSPAATVQPADTSVPTETATPLPTDVATVVPTDTPGPVATDTPTPTVAPTDIPTPTATPAVTPIVSVTCRVSVEINGTPSPFRPC